MAFLNGPERILDTGMEGFAAGFAVDDDELVATYAVGLFAKGLEDALRGATDEGITGLMSLEVIDLLQAVQVEVGDPRLPQSFPDRESQTWLYLFLLYSPVERSSTYIWAMTSCCSAICLFWSSICSRR